jgi:hypothetical protein
MVVDVSETVLERTCRIAAIRGRNTVYLLKLATILLEAFVLKSSPNPDSLSIAMREWSRPSTTNVLRKAESIVPSKHVIVLVSAHPPCSIVIPRYLYEHWA